MRALESPSVLQATYDSIEESIGEGIEESEWPADLGKGRGGKSLYPTSGNQFSVRTQEYALQYSSQSHSSVSFLICMKRLIEKI